MNPSSLSIIRAAASESLFDEEGQPLTLTLTDPVESSESDPDLSELLAACSGFKLGLWEDMNFVKTRYSGTGDFLDSFFPDWIELCMEATGDDYVLELPPVGSEGQPGPVWFVCHDPPAIVLIANTLAEFLKIFFDRFRKVRRYANTALDDAFDLAMKMWDNDMRGVPSSKAANSPDPELQALSRKLGPKAWIHDTRSMQPRQGFQWEITEEYEPVQFVKDYRVRGGPTD
ncbi:MAG: SMI1/KNR4 family protein [Tepidisphaera sp.]